MCQTDKFSHASPNQSLLYCSRPFPSKAPSYPNCFVPLIMAACSITAEITTMFCAASEKLIFQSCCRQATWLTTVEWCTLKPLFVPPDILVTGKQCATGHRAGRAQRAWAEPSFHPGPSSTLGPKIRSHACWIQFKDRPPRYRHWR